jgi:hypothetical protein
VGPLEHSNPASIALFRLHLFKKILGKSPGRDGLSFSNLSPPEPMVQERLLIKLLIRGGSKLDSDGGSMFGAE